MTWGPWGAVAGAGRDGHILGAVGPWQRRGGLRGAGGLLEQALEIERLVRYPVVDEPDPEDSTLLLFAG